MTAVDSVDTSTRKVNEVRQTETDRAAARDQHAGVERKIEDRTRTDATRVAERVTAEPAASTREDSGDAYDRLHKEMATGEWAKSETAATAQAERIREAARGVPEADRAAFVSGLVRPVENMIQSGGLTDPATGRISGERARIAGAFADQLGQNSVNAIGTALNQNGDHPESRTALLSTLGKVADTNASPGVRSSAAQMIMAGPIDGVKDALAGRVPGLSADKLANYGTEHGSIAAQQRLLGASEGLDPSVRQTLEAKGIETTDIPGGGTEAIHSALDVASAVPALNVPASALNAGLYGAEGDPGNAALAAAGLIPGAGAAKLAAKALKAAKAAKVAENAVGVVKRLPDGREVKRLADGRVVTAPHLPPRKVAESNGVRIEHNYRSNDHPPAHMHVTGGGRTTRIGPNGKPLEGEPPLSPQQQAVVDAHLSEIRRTGDRIGRWLWFNAQ